METGDKKSKAGTPPSDRERYLYLEWRMRGAKKADPVRGELLYLEALRENGIRAPYIPRQSDYVKKYLKGQSPFVKKHSKGPEWQEIEENPTAGLRAENRNYAAWNESRTGDNENDFKTESAQMNPDVLSDQESFYAILSGKPNESARAVTARKALKSWHSILSGQQREVFRLHFFQELSFLEIARQLRIREDTARDYWDGARDNLKKYFR